MVQSVFRESGRGASGAGFREQRDVEAGPRLRRGIFRGRYDGSPVRPAHDCKRAQHRPQSVRTGDPRGDDDGAGGCEARPCCHQRRPDPAAPLVSRPLPRRTHPARDLLGEDPAAGIRTALRMQHPAGVSGPLRGVHHASGRRASCGLPPRRDDPSLRQPRTPHSAVPADAAPEKRPAQRPRLGGSALLCGGAAGGSGYISYSLSRHDAGERA